MNKLLIDCFEHSLEIIMVGGAVRNRLQLNSKEKSLDIDFEYRGPKDILCKILISHGFIIEELAFEIVRGIKDKMIFEFAPPRIEVFNDNYTHKNFEAKISSALDYRQSFKRRDVTINAIGYNPLTNEYVDPYNGISDFKNRVLKAVDNETFAKDYLRFFRLIKFHLRLGFTIHSSIPFKSFNFSKLNWSLIWKESKEFDLGKYLSCCKHYIEETIPLDEMSKAIFKNEKINFSNIHQLSDLPKELKENGFSKDHLTQMQKELEVKLKTINSLYFNSVSK